MHSPTAVAPATMDEEEIEATNDEIGATTGEELGPADASRLQKKIGLNLQLGSRGCCLRRLNKTPLQRNCLSILKDNLIYCEVVAEFQVMFDSLAPTQSKKVVIEWMRSNHWEGRKKLYRIPFILSPGDAPINFSTLRNSLICSNAMMYLLKRATSGGKTARSTTVP